MPLSKKTLFSLILIFLSCLYPKSTIFAKDSFRTDLDATYEISADAKAKVSFKYSIENLESEILAKEFHVNFTYLKPENLTVSENGKPLEFERTQEQSSYYIKIKFKDDLYGLGKKRIFTIDFIEPNIAKKTGNILEVSIPKINSDEIDEFSASLLILGDVGPLAYIAPTTYEKIDSGYTQYKFRGKSVLENGIKAAFGEFQVFEFSLNYNLENPSTKTSVQEIAVPPDTPYQKVFITKTAPAPVKSEKDEDGNWIFSFKLSPLEKKTVTVEGSVQLFSNPRSLTIPTPQSILNNLNWTPYWSTESYSIKTLADQLKTPYEIYKYVVANLKYDFDRVNPQSERLGSEKALQFSQNALCTEFTDLFIAIARSAGIPAREIQGYAYTNNEKLQPLSLISDVLHAWPQYWDNDKRTWVSVDPTWESTTGEDYFNKFDLNHFAFVIHGASDETPIPAGSYKFSSTPKKDVFIRYGKLPDDQGLLIDAKGKITHNYNPFTKTLHVTLKNGGSNTLYNSQLQIKTNYKNPNENLSVASLIPYETLEKTYKLNYGLFAKNAPETILVTFNDKSFEINTEKEISIISQAAVSLIIIFLVVGYFFISHKRAR